MNAAIIIVIAWFLASLGAIALLSRAWSDLHKAKIRAIQLEIEIGGMKSAVRDLALELGCAAKDHGYRPTFWAEGRIDDARASAVKHS